MDKDLLKGELAKGLTYDIKLTDGGKARLELDYSPGGAFDGGIFINLSAEEIADLAIDKLEQMIPGDQTGIAQKLKDILHAYLNPAPAPAPAAAQP